MMNASRLWILLAVNAVLSCQAAATDATVRRVRDLGPLRVVPIVRARDAGFSARFGGRSVWVFGDTPLNVSAKDGSRWRSSTWGWARDFDARRGLQIKEPVDCNGAPGEFLPFRTEELAYNKEHNRVELGEARSRWGLWAGPLVVEPRTGKAFEFYSKVKCGKGPWDFESIGQSIAVWDEPDRPPVRPEVRPGADEPTLLFPKGDAPPAAGALAVGEWLYTFCCRKEGTIFPCIVGRAAFADALKRQSWRFFTGDGHWGVNWHDAATVMNASPMLSVHWSKHLGRFLAVYSTPLLNTIEIRTARRPEGPWSARRIVLTGLAPTVDGAWAYSGMAHAELERDNGRIEYITYYRDTGFLAGETRLVEVTFE